MFGRLWNPSLFFGTGIVGVGWLTDLRDAVRSLRAARATTVLALAILTLGIAAATVTFSVVDVVALRELPYHNSERLVAFAGISRLDSSNSPLAPQDYFALRRAVTACDDIAAAGYWQLRFGGPDTKPVLGAQTTANFFDVLGVRPLLGHGFTGANESAGNDGVIILGYELWRREYGGDPNVIGRRVAFGQQTREIIGVMSDGFSYLMYRAEPAEFWIPWVPRPQDRSDAGGRSYFLQTFGRLHTGISLQQARAQVDTMVSQQPMPASGLRERFATISLHDFVTGPAKPWLLLMLAAVALVLLTSCVNVANLLLARAAVRRRELATREALGATRGRLARSLLLEGMILAAAAAAGGIAMSFSGVAFTKSLLPEGLAHAGEIAVDGRVLLMSIAAAAVCGLLFGAAPALQAWRSDLTPAIKGDIGGVIGGHSKGRWLRALLVAEVAFVVTLLVATGLVVTSFIRIMTTDLGFDRNDVATFTVSRPLGALPKEARAAAADAFLNDVVERAAAVPGVTAAAIVRDGIPLGGTSVHYSVVLPNGVDTGDVFDLHPVTPGYFTAMALRLARGRVFERSDRQGGPAVAIINEQAARRFFSGVDPIGQVITFRGRTTIVGVVADVRLQGPEVDVRPELYVPLSQELTFLGGAYGDLVVRGAPMTSDLTVRIGTAIAPALGGKAVSQPEYVNDLFRKLTAARRFNAAVLSAFGVIGAFIAAIGIYGVLAFVVAQQVREIGLRMALGASAGSVLAAVLGKALRYVAIGVALGLTGARAVSHMFESLVVGITVTDARIYFGAAAALLAIGLAAALVPALRASRVDPLVALRAE
jgi:putative ABC transport system permease protein